MGKMDRTKKQAAKEAPTAGAPMSEAFRETFLFVLDTEESQAFRRVGDVIQERLLDRVTYQERNPHFSFTLAEMFAVAVDLRFLQGFLTAIGSERSLSDLTPTEQSLSALAERLAPDVAALAGSFEQEIDRLISDDEDAPTRAKQDDGER
jgi:hypothetical protein